MGKASRAKWESRLRVLEDAMRKQYSIKDDGRRWHLSWLISGFIAVATTWATASSGIGMIPLCLVITAATVLSLGLVWVPTPFEKHRAFKGIFSIVLILLSIVGLWWTVTYDRPIFKVDIGGFLPATFRSQSLYMFVEAAIENQGTQTAYSDGWQLRLTLDGKTYIGQQFFSEQIPSGAAQEPYLANQEFPPGKSVRGWLFFAFADIPKKQVDPYFQCGSPLLQGVSMDLSVQDSKEKHEWHQRISAGDLASQLCETLKPHSN